MRNRLALLLLCGLLPAGLLLPACVNVDAPKEVRVGGRKVHDRYDHDSDDDDRYDDEDDRHEERRKREKVSKDDAYAIAKRLARDAGAYPREYNIHDKEIGNVYWVLFEHEQPRRRLGWRNAFCVRVGAFGRAKLYEGKPHGRADLRRGEDKISKDDAYDIAYHVAAERNVRRRDFDVHDKGIDDDRWVLFEPKHDRGRGAWRAAFAVRVGKYGRVSLYED